MRIVVQRVKNAKVEVKNIVVGQIKAGILIFVGFKNGDTIDDLKYMKEKILGLRIFEDENDKMNLSILDIKGDILVVSQFTLYGDVRKGKRPSFTNSLNSNDAIIFYEKFVDMLKEADIKVETGKFQADMKVSLVNDGPVTILLDSDKIF